MLIQLLGVFVTILAVTGVLLNNYKISFCFYLWLISNSGSFLIHYHAQLYTLCLRDAAFIVLAVHGLRSWRHHKQDPPPTIQN